MILVIDCGNSYSNLAIFNDNKIVSKFSLSSDKLKLKNVLVDLINDQTILDAINKVIISSVIPSYNKILLSLAKSVCNNVFFIEDILTKIDIGFEVDNVKEVGSDRIVNSFYAAEVIKDNCIVIDFGTATTFDFISKSRVYLGGLIMPGIRLSLESLAEKTEKLNNVKFTAFDELIGKNTSDAIRAGILYGNLGTINYVYDRSDEVFNSKPRIVATGGFGSIITQNSKIIEFYDPDLTLKGMCLIAQKI